MTPNRMVKSAVVALLLGAAGSAFAQTPPSTFPTDGSILPQNGNGGLLVQAFDPLTGESLTEYLGYNYNTFLPSAVTPAGGETIDFGVIGGTSLWSSTFSGAVKAGDAIDFSVTAVNGLASGSYGLITTVAAGVGPPFTNGSVTNAVNADTTAMAILTGATPCTSGATALANPCQTLSTSDSGYAVVTDIGQNFNAGFKNIYGTAGGPGLDVYQITQSSAKPASTTNTPTEYGTTGGLATFTLSSSGDLVYSSPAAAVPLPAAVWLFGSGLLGLAGIGRRRKAVAA